MGGETLAQAGPAVVSTLALVLSLVGLYLQRKDRRPRLRIRARYEYRAAPAEGASEEGPPPGMHDGSQEGLYLLLGDFLREHGLRYPRGTPVVRFALSNEGERQIFLDSVRLVVRPAGKFPGSWPVLDPAEGRVLPAGLAGPTANVLGEEPAELAPGDGVGYRFGLIRLADVLRGEGYAGNVRLALEATDRLGNVYRRPFEVNTDLWAHPDPEEP